MLQSVSPSGKYVVETTAAGTARDEKHYLLQPAVCRLYSANNASDATVLENRSAARWFTKNGSEYLIANAGKSCVSGYEDTDARYKSVIVNCATRQQIMHSGIQHVHCLSSLALGIYYNGYDSELTVLDLCGVENGQVVQVPFDSSCGSAERVINGRLFESDAFTVGFLEEEKRGIVCVFGEYYRLFNGMAWLDDETTFEGDTHWEGDPRAVYNSGRNGAPDNYDFVFAQVETIVFTMNERGALVVSQRYTAPRRTMPIAEFDALYVRERCKTYQKAWLRENNIIPKDTRWV
jgi:hypothetical protein